MKDLTQILEEAQALEEYTVIFIYALLSERKISRVLAWHQSSRKPDAVTTTVDWFDNPALHKLIIDEATPKKVTFDAVLGIDEIIDAIKQELELA